MMVYPHVMNREPLACEVPSIGCDAGRRCVAAGPAASRAEAFSCLKWVKLLLQRHLSRGYCRHVVGGWLPAAANPVAAINRDDHPMGRAVLTSAVPDTSE